VISIVVRPDRFTYLHESELFGVLKKKDDFVSVQKYLFNEEIQEKKE
jgi:hypothetical protein